MNSKRPSPATVARLQAQYPEGCRVVLVSMGDANDPCPHMPPGMEGTVDFVDDTGTIFVNWDNGSSLGAAYPIDKVRKISKPCQ